MSQRRSQRIFKRNHRRVPNEISLMVIDNLADDLPSLRNLALACRDFAASARPYIFREIDLASSSSPNLPDPTWTFPLVHRLDALLRTSEINRFVQRLHLSSSRMSLDELELTAHILHRLTALASLSIHDPVTHLFKEVETSSFVGTLKQLYIDPLMPHSLHFISFQRMLMSFSCLEVLAVCGSPEFSEHRALLLPNSLRVGSFTDTSAGLLRSVGAGLEIAPLPFLRTLVLEPLSAGQDPITWNGLGRDTQIIYMVQPSYFNVNQASTFNFATRGMTVSKLMFICLQSPWLAPSFVSIIAHLPDTVREVCIDIAAMVRSSDRFISEHQPEEWTKLDSAFVARHERGLLKRVCFRCTEYKGADSPHYIFSYYSLYHPPIGFPLVKDRSILDQMKNLLPRSKSMGFLDIDFDTMFFEPTM
ncbi:hypothetical protein GYMLUDRAFT_245167 [Collybiopsis luxurians FD-317 M1]|uniref:F-box domain-containing protein n=1 Tax=Collybiopsis luxurians FD-317 M1 TaxID=944289 RepID=A0A0D0BVE0_9AGAR|nr:hypothetical protein GYMLUDRAFT_245167 [Collybiopsis luxurians FD-317 M1]